MINLIFSKRFLRRKLVITTAILTFVYHLYSLNPVRSSKSSVNTYTRVINRSRSIEEPVIEYNVTDFFYKKNNKLVKKQNFDKYTISMEHVRKYVDSLRQEPNLFLPKDIKETYEELNKDVAQSGKEFLKTVYKNKTLQEFKNGIWEFIKKKYEMVKNYINVFIKFCNILETVYNIVTTPFKITKSAFNRTKNYFVENNGVIYKHFFGPENIAKRSFDSMKTYIERHPDNKFIKGAKYTCSAISTCVKYPINKILTIFEKNTNLDTAKEDNSKFKEIAECISHKIIAFSKGCYKIPVKIFKGIINVCCVVSSVPQKIFRRIFNRPIEIRNDQIIENNIEITRLIENAQTNESSLNENIENSIENGQNLENSFNNNQVVKVNNSIEKNNEKISEIDEKDINLVFVLKSIPRGLLMFFKSVLRLLNPITYM